MINKIVKGISQALSKEFGDSCSVYTEPVKEELNETYFTISNTAHSCEPKLGNRYNNKNSFTIQYISKSDNLREEIGNVIERMEEALRFIQIDEDLVRGSGMKSTIVEEGLNFQIDYNVRTYKSMAESERMNNLKLEG